MVDFDHMCDVHDLEECNQHSSAKPDQSRPTTCFGDVSFQEGSLELT